MLPPLEDRLRPVMARRGGSRLYCPLIEIAADSSPHGCDYPSRAQTTKGSRAIRRHFREHVAAFRAARDGLLRYAQPGSSLGSPGFRIELSLTKGSFARDDEHDGYEDLDA